MPYLDINFIETTNRYENIDCLSEPIAVACAFYNPLFYNLFCGYYAVNSIWKAPNDSFIMECNSIMQKFGLQLSGALVRNPDEALNKILEALRKGIPVFICLKYGFLYYHRAYLDSKMKEQWHGLLVVGYEEERQVFYIKDRASIDVKGLICIQVPFCVLRDMWINSHHANDIIFYNSIFTVEKVEDCLQIEKINWNQLQYNITETNQYIDFIKNNAPNVVQQVIEAKRKYVGCTKLIFDYLDCSYPLKSSMHQRKFEKFRQEYISYRDKIFLLLYKNSCVGKKLGQEKMDEVCSCILNNDLQLASMALELEQEDLQKQKSRHYINADIQRFYNNKAFDSSVSLQARAEVNNLGTYLLYETKGYQNQFFDASKRLNQMFDNVYCDGQSIAIDVDKYTDVMFVCCATPGDADVIVKLIYDSNDIFNINLRITDFLRAPKFSESICWQGKAIKKLVRDNICKVHSDKARIYMQSISVPQKGSIVEIQLPYCPQLHIFNIVFGVLG